MSASSAIPITPSLASALVSTQHTRFIKVSIHNEQLVHDLTIQAVASFEHDLALLPDILQDHVPAYILAKVSPSDWTVISYVPDSAKVRDKMLYASTRASLLRALGSSLFTDSIFATTKADLTPEAYAAHRRHINAPKPLSVREQEMADVRTAESGSAYQGSRARVNHIGARVGFSWAQGLQDTVKQLAQAEQGAILIMEIDKQTESLIPKSTSEATIQTLPTLLPSSQPCYALFAWPHEYTSPPRCEIIYIYSCPSTSPVKDRMIYSSGVSSTYQTIKALLDNLSPTTHLASRRIETSDPSELDEAYLKAELGFDVSPTDGQETVYGNTEEKKPFARPRGPARKR